MLWEGLGFNKTEISHESSIKSNADEEIKETATVEEIKETHVEGTI